MGELTVGCMDVYALNYDATAGIPCNNCCEYQSSPVIGCMDVLASNYDSVATKPCPSCCKYDVKDEPIFVGFNGGFGGSSGTIYPYDVNPIGANCISNLPYYNDTWLKIPTVHGTGYNNYRLDLSSVVEGSTPQYIPNWGLGGTLNVIWDAFDVLLRNKPNHRVFINNTEFTPWVIPLHSDYTPLTTNPNQQQFKSDCDMVGGEIYTYQGDVDTQDKKSHFIACLCSDTDIIEPTICKTTNIDGETVTMSESKSDCINNYDDFRNFLKNQLVTNNLTRNTNGSINQTSFFNTFLLTEMGISIDDANFIVENLVNPTPAYYPYQSSTLDSINGSARSYGIIKNAFLNGANFITPLPYNQSTDIITKKECCDLVGGIYKSGEYNPSTNSEGQFRRTGVCLCNVVTEPCPTLIDGTLQPQVEVIETSGGLITTTTVKVTEECCSNTSLQSKMVGNWTWDGSRCVLITEEVGCNASTTLTISETPINLGKEVNCLQDIVTISAYIYFEEPNNKCTNGEPVLNDNPLTEDIITLYNNPPETAGEISTYSNEVNWNPEVTNPSEPTVNLNSGSNCCYDTNTPIIGQLVLQDINHQKISTPEIIYVDTFSSTQTTINTSASVGSGFNRWVKLTTTVDISVIDTSTPFFVAVEFTQGLSKCCSYDIYFDDIDMGCQQIGVREIFNTEKCPGFELRHVIDNKKSWVYNPGTELMSNSVEDNIIRNNGTRGMNVSQSNPYTIDGGHGVINRVFAPSVDADLPFRATDYFDFHGVVEKHSKLVLNSKEVTLQFNMCADGECTINPTFLVDDYGTFVTDEYGNKIIIDSPVTFPNLIQLETYKKSFQGFWVQFMEQFIPATTIFISGEKWCNSRICEEKIVSDYTLDVTNDSGVISPTPTTETTVDTPNVGEPNTKIQLTPNKGTSGEKGGTTTDGLKGSSNTDELGPIIVGNTKIYTIETLDPDLGNVVRYRTLKTT